MTRLSPAKVWWTAAEIAEAGLPDLPGTKRGVSMVSDRLKWTSDPARARRREGKGGGWEYHWTLFPSRAQKLLLAQVQAPVVAPDRPARDEAWAWFEGLPASVRALAETRLHIIQCAEALEVGGLVRDQAIRDAAEMGGVSPRSVWNWRVMIEGVRRDDRLPYLAPRHRAVVRKTRAAQVDPEFAAIFKADYLRPEQPTLQSAYDRTVRVAEAKGIPVPPVHTVRRWLRRSVSDISVLLLRKGYDYVKAMYPPQVRDKSAMHALEAVNADFHRFDVFVRFPGPGGRGEEIIRPQMVAFQDIYSGRLLAWRIDRTANSHAVQQCIGDLIETWGIPDHVLLDNGREFAAKTITGGSPTRFRFKVKEDDVPGLLTSLGCNIHWATPYSGQSKPVERAFRDLCDRVAKHPAFAGAYTGNRPEAKPENYGEKAIPLDQFLSVLAEELEQHNLRPGRRSEVAFGRSFAQVFDESYATAPIRKATAEQRRLWLMGAEGIRGNARTGQLMFQGNAYWADWMHAIRGQKVIARFDSAALWDGLHVYALSGEYLGHAPCRSKAGFFDIDDARAHTKARTGWMKAERAAARAQLSVTPEQVAADLAAIAHAAPEPATPEAKVVRLVRPDIAAPRPVVPVVSDPRVEATQAAMVADFMARQAVADQAATEAEARDTFIRARTIEQALAAGDPVTKEQQKWLAGYQTTPDYRTWAGMVTDFGEGVLAK